MNLEKHKAGVGAFLLCAIALFVIGIVALGGGNLLNRDTEYVLYFNNSVAGLSIGSPVMLRGVPLGSVTRISLMTTSSNANVTTPVHIRINASSLTLATGESVEDEAMEEEVIREMVTKGLRAQLRTASLLTGQSLIQLDFYPETKANFQSPNPLVEIPTMNSPMDTLQQTLSKLPLEEIAASMQRTLFYVNDFITSGKVDKTLANINATFATMNSLLQQFEGTPAATQKILDNLKTGSAQLPQAMDELQAALRAFAAVADELRLVASSAHALVAPNSPLATQLSNLISDGAAAARSMRSFADTLDRNPESILRGRQGAY